MRHLSIGALQTDLEHSLDGMLGALRLRDPLSAVCVFVPTHTLGRHLARTVARRQTSCFNVSFLTFPDFAHAVALERLAPSGRIPQPPLADFLLARRAIAAKVGEGGYFAPVSAFPNTPQTILASLGDLKRVGIGPDRLAAAAKAPRSAKLVELAAIYAEIEGRQSEAGYFDVSDALAAAADAAATSHLLKDALAICLYGFRQLSHLEQAFFKACVARVEAAHAFVPDDPGGRTEPLIAWLLGEGFAPVPSPAPSAVGEHVRDREHAPALILPRDVSIISAPGLTAEVQEMARRLLTFAAQPGASFSDAAVLLRHPAAYERTIRDVFGAAGIPYVMLDGEPVSDTLTGRLLDLLVRIRLGDFPRAEVMEFLSLAPLRPSLLEACPDASPADWERHSREAGIVRGREHWRRIGRERERLEWRIARSRKEAGDGPVSPHVALLERKVLLLRTFERAVNALLRRLSALPDRAPFATLLGGLLRALLALARLPEGERNVVAAMARPARECADEEEVSFEAFAAMADELLSQRLPPSDVYRSGRVIVGSLHAAFGLPFRLALIPGLVERSFPPPPAQDPVLLDREREALNARYGAALTTREDQAADEMFSFRHAAAAAGEALVLSYPRMDAATGKTRVPSHFLLRVAEALTGQPSDYRALGALTERVPIERIQTERVRLTAAEWDLSRVAQAVASGSAAALAGLPGFAAVARGIRAEASRWERNRLTEYDGVLGVAVPLPATMAATYLETYGTCPFRYFGKHVLGVSEVEEPEEAETISPLDRGKIIHDILDQFLSGLVKDGQVPMQARRAEAYRRRLEKTARAALEEFEAAGAVGYPFMWEVEQARILTDLEGFLTAELADEFGYVPAYFEARFGPVRWGAPPPGSSPEPVKVRAGRRVLRFTGYIDRIDVHRTAGARVLDYKTGGVFGVKEDAFSGGLNLQLPLYLLAADQLLAHYGVPGQAREAQYYYVTGRGGFRRVRFTREALDGRQGEFNMILETMADGIAAGLFPQAPGETGGNCGFCDFTWVCGSARVGLAERKVDDPAIKRLRDMWEIP